MEFILSTASSLFIFWGLSLRVLNLKGSMVSKGLYRIALWGCRHRRMPDGPSNGAGIDRLGFSIGLERLSE